MKISFAWLQEFLPDLAAKGEEVAQKLTLHTAEVEEVVPIHPFFSQVYFGVLEKASPHPKKDHLTVGTFRIGNHTHTIVFGNTLPLHKGDVVPIALPGAVLYSGLTIKQQEIAGVISEGMVCDNQELGLLFPGIIRLSDPSASGKSLAEVFSLEKEVVFDIDNKSLTHRPDLMGHRGFARELSCIFDTKLLLPEPAVFINPELPSLSARIEASSACRRFCLYALEGLKVGEAPLEKQMRLSFLGVRAINNIVDVTNLIMLSYGQPMHAYDAKKITGEITVRFAHAGESFTALDGNTYTLTEEDLVIADEKGVLGLAGVIGGLHAAVTEATESIILEAAHFDPTIVRKTAQRHGIRTESSMRFEKSLDPEQCLPALLRAVEYLQQWHQQARATHQLLDLYPSPYREKHLTLSLDLLETYYGGPVSLEESQYILEKLGFEGEAVSSRALKVSVPSFRATKDIAREEDLIEEVIRIKGFESIDASPLVLAVKPPPENFLRDLEWKLRDSLACKGFLEVYTYPFMDLKLLSRFPEPKETYVEIENPLSESYQYLRQRLLSGMVGDLKKRLKQHKHLAYFEFGKVFHKRKAEIEEYLKGIFFLAERKKTPSQVFFALKTVWESILYPFHIRGEDLVYEPLKHPLYHPTHAASIKTKEGFLLGELALLHPYEFPLSGASVGFVEWNMEALASVITQAQHFQYKPLNPYPPVRRDLSIILPKDVSCAEVIALLKSTSPYLEEVTFFDEYLDEAKFGKDRKNLAFHLVFRGEKETLTDALVDKEFQRILEALTSLKAQLRLDFEQKTAKK